MELDLPEPIYLEDFQGDIHKYIEAVYEIFKNDFVTHKPKFRGERLGLKYHPEIGGKAYTFYHITSSGKDESNRNYDLRRCERVPWAKPCIENVDNWELKVWEQKRKNERRICIWLELEDEPDYFIVLNRRKGYLLLWTAFVLEYEHEKRKKQRDYERAIKEQGPQSN